MSEPTRASEPLVSIVVPAYNRARYIGETLESIFAQDYKNIEIICIDDGSSDETHKILLRYGSKIKSIRQENFGENVTVNRGFALANGRYVCVVNSDDPLLPGCISRLVRELEADPQALIAYGDWAAIGPDHEFLKHERLRTYTTEHMFEALNFGMGPGMLIRRSAIDRFGSRLEHYRFAGDMEFCLRFSLHGRFVYVPKLLATHRVHPDSLSVKADRNKIGQEFADAFVRTINNPAFPLILLRKKHHYIAEIYRVVGDKYATSWHKRLKYRTCLIFESIVSYLSFSDTSSAIRILTLKAARRSVYALSDTVVLLSRLLTRPRRGAADGKSVRFVFCTRFLPPLWSGQAVVIGRLLKNVDPARYRLAGHPVASSDGKENDFVGRLSAVPYELPPVRDFFPASQEHVLLRTLNLMGGIWQRAWQIVHAVRQDRPDVLIGCTGDQIDPPATWLAAQILRSRFCMYFFDDYGEQWWADPAMRRVIRRIQHYLVPRSQILIAPNAFMAEKLRNMYGVHCHIVPNPMPSARLPKLVETFPANGKTIRLTFTGAVYHLNYGVLRSIVEAISLNEDMDAELHIYTAQSHEQIAAQGICGAKVILHQHAPPDEVVEAQCNADILLIPFNDDPECLELVRVSATAKLADYLATGRPILTICPEDSFLATFFREQKCGLALAQTDPAAIQDMIHMIAADPQLRKEMSIAARKCAKTIFHPDLVRKHFLDIIEAPA